MVRSGVGQMYMDVNSQHWQLLSKAITDKGHAVYHTLEQIYSGHRSAVCTFTRFFALLRASYQLLVLRCIVYKTCSGFMSYHFLCFSHYRQIH